MAIFVTNKLNSADGTANICQKFKVKCASNDNGQQ